MMVLKTTSFEVKKPPTELENILIYDWEHKKPTINKICEELGVDQELMFRVVDCESRWNNDARGRAGEIGLAQFMPQTWNWLTKKYNLEHLDIHDEYDQLYLMALAWHDGLHHHWTCYRLVEK